MVLGILFQALTGAAGEVREAPTFREKVRKAASLSRTFIWEMLKMSSGLPYAYHSKSLWGNPEKYQEHFGFNLLRDVRYGPAERNLLDIYTPKNCDSTSSLPVVMFIHGGVWASGDKSLYSPIGATLAHHGVLALLMQYTLYPQVLAKDQVKEASQALSWAVDNAKSYGGNPQKIHVMGHSSGAHVCGMLFWERARQSLTFKNRSSTVAQRDKQQPRCYIGLSGVYNMFEHYKYECRRGVGSMSCLKPSMDGLKGFPSMSPELLFNSLLDLKVNRELEDTNISTGGNDLSDVDSESMNWQKWAAEQPPFIFFASEMDNVVPPTTSIHFHNVLRDLRCKSSLSLLENVSHADFACWMKGLQGNDNPAATILIRDILDIVKEELTLDGYLRVNEDLSADI